MATTTAQPELAALPLTPLALHVALANGQQIDWVSKIAEVMRDQFGLKPKQ